MRLSSVEWHRASHSRKRFSRLPRSPAHKAPPQVIQPCILSTFLSCLSCLGGKAAPCLSGCSAAAVRCQRSRNVVPLVGPWHRQKSPDWLCCPPVKPRVTWAGVGEELLQVVAEGQLVARDQEGRAEEEGAAQAQERLIWERVPRGGRPLRAHCLRTRPVTGTLVMPAIEHASCCITSLQALRAKGKSGAHCLIQHWATCAHCTVSLRQQPQGVALLPCN